MARAAPACERYRHHASRPNQAGGTCTYDNPAGSRPGALARSLRMTSTWSASCLCSGVLSWADSPVAAGRSVKAKDQRTGLPGGRRCHRRQAAGPTPQLIGADTVGAIPGALEELHRVRGFTSMPAHCQPFPALAAARPIPKRAAAAAHPRLALITERGRLAGHSRARSRRSARLRARRGAILRARRTGRSGAARPVANAHSCRYE
jgi:hypothetical protein